MGVHMTLHQEIFGSQINVVTYSAISD